VAYEKELALLVGDINQHISNVRGASNGSRNKSTHLGELQVTDQPAGVSLILTGLDNPIRYMVAPLAASIAAGNVTILATAAGKQDRLISLLLRQWSTYLDRDCIFLVPEFEITELETDSVDIITIFGTSSRLPNTLHSIKSFYACAD
jgi:acyl-CoA reductase-like NAD-dependent aldehyde dehydrogenase